jgi:hypothetical protein
MIRLIKLSTNGLVDINSTTNQYVGIIFWSLSIALNVILTVLIVGRLSYLSRLIGKALHSLEERNSNIYGSDAEHPSASGVALRSPSEQMAPRCQCHPSQSSLGSEETTARGSSPRSVVESQESNISKFSAASYTNFKNKYTSVGAMLIESAALYQGANICFLVTFVLSGPGGYILLTLVGVLAVSLLYYS